MASRNRLKASGPSIISGAGRVAISVSVYLYRHDDGRLPRMETKLKLAWLAVAAFGLLIAWEWSSNGRWQPVYENGVVNMVIDTRTGLTENTRPVPHVTR